MDYRDIDGWFDFEDVYRRAVAEAQDGAVFVEIGCWLGKSTAFLAAEIRRSGKRIRLHVVDVFNGSIQRPDGIVHDPEMRAKFEANLRACGLLDLVTVHPVPSADAARRFADNSLAFVFIDGAHDIESASEDIAAWLPKVQVGGVLAGHDIDLPGVHRAVLDRIGCDFTTSVRSWIHRRPQRPVISIATTCKGRLQHLKRALPRFLGQECPVPFEVVIVDFGCPERSGEWAESVAHQSGAGRLRVVRAIHGTDRFHAARAKNIGGIHAAGQFVAFVDCDLLLPKTFLADALHLIQTDGLDLLMVGLSGEPVPCDPQNSAYRFPDRSQRPHTYHAPVFRRSVFLQLRGHDESFRGWGYEDADLNARANLLGHPWAWWQPELDCINHGDHESLQFFDEKTREESSAANLARGAGQLRTVNPGLWGQL